MRSTTSLRRFIIFSIAATCVVLAVCCFFLLRFYLTHGLHMDTEFRLESEANKYLEEYENNPDTSLPKTATITAYLGYDALPEIIRKGADKEELVPGTFLQTGTKENFSYMYTAKRPDGALVHFVFQFQPSRKPLKSIENFFAYYLYLPIAIGVVSTTLIILLAVYMLKRGARPVEDLRNWAMTLEMEHLEKEAPDFTYSELNQLAEMFRSNLRRLSAGIEREHQFQQYASHELRTPIAILKNNLELMEQLGIQENKRYVPAFSRMEKAVMKMQFITTTLLWVCREEKTRLPHEEVKLGALLSSIVHENEYLLEGKDINLETSFAAKTIQAPKTIALIILSNLVRNALQHTLRGDVSMRLDAASLRIRNDNAGNRDDDTQEGFGLGLMLTRQLASSISWDIQIQDQDGTFTVDVFFDQDRDKSNTDNA